MVFLTPYMQGVLGYSQIQAGAAYLPLCFGVIVAAGVYLLARVPVDGSYTSDLLPGLLIASLGLGTVFVGVTTAANSGVSADKAGLAAALLNTSQQLGAVIGLRATDTRGEAAAPMPEPAPS
jgi:hypothetical protein